jgi:hypothetical protein
MTVPERGGQRGPAGAMLYPAARLAAGRPGITAAVPPMTTATRLTAVSREQARAGVLPAPTALPPHGTLAASAALPARDVLPASSPLRMLAPAPGEAGSLTATQPDMSAQVSGGPVR